MSLDEIEEEKVTVEEIEEMMRILKIILQYMREIKVLTERARIMCPGLYRERSAYLYNGIGFFLTNTLYMGVHGNETSLKDQMQMIRQRKALLEDIGTKNDTNR